MNEALSGLMEAFSFPFVYRALAAGVLIAVACSLIGLFLVLRKLSLIGDGLAHASFAAAALALTLGWSPLFVSVPVAMLASLGVLKLAERSTNGDAAIGIFSSLGVAIGVIMASVGGGFNVDLFSFLFGSILAIGAEELAFSAVLSAAVLVLVVAYYKDLFALSYDEDFAKVSGVRTKALNRLLAMLAAAVVALGIRVVGTMLVSALIVLPASTAQQLGKGFKATLALSALFAAASVVVGILASLLFNLPAGACVVVVGFCLFAIAHFAGGK